MSNVDFDSTSVQSYLGILQSVIGRMASNSAACKTWCIALVSAMVVIIAGQRKPDYIWISIIPIVLLFFLDSYYLGLERQFRSRYNDFIKKIHLGSATIDDVFIISPDFGVRKIFALILKASASISIWPFYGLLTIMLIIVRIAVL